MVKSLSKVNGCFVEDEAPLLHADYVLGSIWLEDLADKFWVAGSHEDYREGEIFLALLDVFVYPLSTNKVTISKIVFKKKVVTFKLALTRVEQAHVLLPLSLLDTVARYMQDLWFLADGFLEVGLRRNSG